MSERNGNHEPATLGDATAAVQHRQRHQPPRLKELFQKFSQKTSAAVGTPWAFLLAAGIVIAWAFTRRLFQSSDTWQLVINTGTTIVTFLMVFLIQNTQNRDTLAINLKLDEIIRSIRHAHNEMINIEKLSDEELADLAKHYERIREEHDHRAARKLLNNAKKNIPA